MITGFRDLPYELHLLVASHLEKAKDVASLRQLDRDQYTLFKREFPHLQDAHRFCPTGTSIHLFMAGIKNKLYIVQKLTQAAKNQALFAAIQVGDIVDTLVAIKAGAQVDNKDFVTQTASTNP